MITLDEAVRRVMATVVPAGAEAVPLEAALGRVVAADVVATVDVPPWDASGMDGYAVRATDLGPTGGALRLLEVVGAGAVPSQALGRGEATVVMTGAPLPEGADAVVLVEDSDGARTGRVALREGARPGQHVRRRGCDLAVGDSVVARGQRLGVGALGLLASIGHTSAHVARRPVVAILTTGDELVRPGTPRAPGQIWSTNHLTLAAAVSEAGALPRDAGLVGDDPRALRVALEACLDADVVLTTGGVSVGDFDHVKDVLADLGVSLDFWKIRMKPGKPLVFGVAERGGVRRPVFGLPGNPVSCLVVFLQVVRPWLRAALGDPRPFLPVVDAVAGEDLRGRPGRARLERVRLTVEAGRWVARSTGDQSSGVLTSMARAHGLLLVAADQAGPAAGDPVRVQLLDPGFLDQDAPGYDG